MAITRNPKGTASSKTSGTTLSVSNVNIERGHSIVVGVAYETGQGAPVVTWGRRELSRIVTRSQSGMATALFILRHIKNTSTRNITATWGGAITAKAMFVTELVGANIQDVSQGNTQIAAVNPATGPAVSSTAADTASIAAFGSRGPSSDTVGTINAGHTSGQRVGTVGAPPVSNVTIHETWELLPDSASNVRSRKIGATERDWANVILNLKAGTAELQGISPSDMAEAQALFEAAGLNFDNHAFHFNDSDDRWEVFDGDINGTKVGVGGDTGLWSAP